MSLFKLREFWTTHCEDDEYFDQNSLILTTLNSDSDFIISGSQSGVLRIFKPSCSLTETNSLSGYVPNDLLVEKIINVPILQVGCGKLVSGSQNTQLAILHPKLVSVYHLKVKEGATEHGTQNYLDLLYEHHLERSAANFTTGPFGGTQHRDFICVQSLDGMLSFFEQETATFSCFLPDFLLPGPLTYFKKTDSFVTVSCSWDIVAYKYNQLSEAGGKSDDSINSVKKASCDWTYNLGEMVIDICVIEDLMNTEGWILVLGEKNLYCLNKNGKLKFMKRLEYSPSCFHAYVLDDNIFTIVVSETNTLLIYENTTVKWSAKLQFLPVLVRRGFLEHIKGTLVLLSEEGRVECGYLGTEPSLFVAPPLTQKEIDFEKVQDELDNLNRHLRNSYASDIKLTNPNAEKEFSLNVIVDNELRPCTYSVNLSDSDNQQMCSLTIEIFPQVIFEEVQVILTVPPPLKITPTVQHFCNLSEKTSFTCHAYLYDDFEIPTLNVNVVATLITSLGVPRCISKSVMLPLQLVADACLGLKEGQHKITLNINETPVPLLALFPDFAENPLLTQTTNAIGFKLISNVGMIVTILLAKNSNRYRLQSDSFASLSLITDQMIFRLRRHYSNTDDFLVFYNTALPSSELTFYVNEHFSKRQEISNLQDDLSQLSAQFRIIQKRLIVKLKAKNPAPLTNLEVLLKDTYSDIIDVTEKLEMAQFKLFKTQIELSCALHLLGNLIKMLEIDKNSKELLESVFCSSVHDLEAQNWEDVIDASLCYLLRTTLAKSAKDKLRIAQTSIEEVKDVSKVEKHLVQVLDRVSKKEKTETDEVGTNDDNLEIENTNEKENEKAVGSQFGEASTRLLSARKSLLRKRHKLDT